MPFVQIKSHTIAPEIFRTNQHYNIRSAVESQRVSEWASDWVRDNAIAVLMLVVCTALLFTLICQQFTWVQFAIVSDMLCATMLYVWGESSARLNKFHRWHRGRIKHKTNHTLCKCIQLSSALNASALINENHYNWNRSTNWQNCQRQKESVNERESFFFGGEGEKASHAFFCQMNTNYHAVHVRHKRHI